MEDLEGSAKSAIESRVLDRAWRGQREKPARGKRVKNGPKDISWVPPAIASATGSSGGRFVGLRPSASRVFPIHARCSTNGREVGLLAHRARFSSCCRKPVYLEDGGQVFRTSGPITAPAASAEASSGVSAQTEPAAPAKVE